MIGLQPPLETLIPYAKELYATYHNYCGSVSIHDHALSLQTSAYLMWLCDTTQPNAVADLGSGFSSYVFRMACPDAVVHSVDSDRTWLTRSQWFVADHDLPTDGFMTGDEWLTLDCRYDVVLNDYAGGTTREEFAPIAADHLAPGGVLVFDDAHHPSHRFNMATVCMERGMPLLDLMYQTVDQIGRYAMVGVKP